MANVLDRILAVKRREVDVARERVPLAELRQRAIDASPSRGFERALRAKIAAGKPGIIAEIKRASPSKGLIRANLDPAVIAASYEGPATADNNPM